MKKIKYKLGEYIFVAEDGDVYFHSQSIGSRKISLDEWMLKKLGARLLNDSECEHEHLSCPGDIKTLKCAYCNKSMYQEPKDKIERISDAESIKGSGLAYEEMIENKIQEIIDYINSQE